jgi:acetyl-CoA acetyltransferase
MTDYPEKKVIISGVGQSDVARPSPKSASALTVDACERAVADAGLTLADIDGLATYPGAMNNGDGMSPISATHAMLALGIRPQWVSSSNDGHSHMGPIFHAIMAIASGMCRHVLIFRTLTQASARAEVKTAGIIGGGRTLATRIWGGQSWSMPYHAYSAADMFGMYAQAYFTKYGATSEQLGAIAVNSRKMAAFNPNAIYRKPITIEDYLNSRMIASPLRLYDCDTHIDGSTALVLSRRDYGKDLPHRPIEIESIGMSLSGIGMGEHEGDLTGFGATRAGDMLWSRTDLKPSDVDTAQIYDGFSILTLLWLEAAKLCGTGEAASFVEGGHRIGLDGELPLNTSGGQLSAGRFHGYGHTFEACAQLFGRAGERQVKDAEVCLVANGGWGYGALLLKRG